MGDNCHIGAGSVVLRDVPENSTVVGGPAHVIFRNGRRVVTTDPKRINDPLSEALAAVVSGVKTLRDTACRLQGRAGWQGEHGDKLQRLIEIEYQI